MQLPVRACNQTSLGLHGWQKGCVAYAEVGSAGIDRSFSKGAAAGIIIGAVVFGLLAGVGTGCAIIRCYTIYMHCQQGGPHAKLSSLWRHIALSEDSMLLQQLLAWRAFASTGWAPSLVRGKPSCAAMRSEDCEKCVCAIDAALQAAVMFVGRKARLTQSCVQAGAWGIFGGSSGGDACKTRAG